MKKTFLTLLLATSIGFTACPIPSWVNTAEAIAKIAAPIAGSIVDLVDPALAPLVAAAEAGFNALIGALDTYKVQPTANNLQVVEAALTALQTNETALENAAQATPQQDATINGVLALVDQAVIEIAAQIPAPVSTQLKIKQIAYSKGWKASDFRKNFDSLTKGDPRFKKL